MGVVPGERWRLCASAVLTIAASSVPLTLLGAQGAAQVSTGSVVGRVTQAPGNVPVTGARVQALVLPGRTVAGAGTTGADGRFRIGGLRPGAYALVVTRIGYQLQRIDSLRVTEGQTATANLSLTELASNLDQVVVTSSRAPEKILDAPASISVVPTERIERRPTVTAVDHLRETPGVDVAQGGIAQSMVVARGFNNAFSGALLILQDYRFASVPSLRVNIPFLNTGTNEDVERIEVLLGPASALYGPNSANGVVHIITKSPLTYQGTTLTVDGGERSLLRGAFRTAHKFGERVGFKVSGETFQARDWEYRDPAEPSVFPNTIIAPGRRNQPNARDYSLRRYSGEARLDVRPTDNLEAITTLGHSNVGRALELTSANGASQIRNWTYTSLQQRVRYKRLFAQAFVNASNAGNDDSLDLSGTFIRRTGQPIVDKSRVYAGQVQHAADFAGDRQRLVYGVDYIRTDPRTFGTTNGRNESGDNTTEYGGYVQSTTRVTRRVDLIGALRADRHDRLVGTFWSPRAAVQFKPTETHNVRVAYNRAFQTPANFNLFLDLDQARSISGLPYNIRALGVPADGYQFRRDCAAGTGGLCMRSPFTPAAVGGPGAFVPANAAGYFPAAVQVAVAGGLRSSLVTAGVPAAAADAIIASLPGTNVAAVGSSLRLLNTSTNQFVPVTPASVVDLPRLRPTFVNNYEVGYKGIIADRLRIAIDGWHQQRNQLLTAAVNVTPNVFLDPVSLTAAVQQRITPIVGPSAPAIAQSVAAGLARVPVGTVVPDNPLTERGNIYFSYRNIDRTIRLYGSDMAVDFLATPRITLAGTYSWLSKVQFDDVTIGPAAFSLNSPAHKASFTSRFDDRTSGLGFELRGRYTDAFPVNSGVFVGNVPVSAMVDAGASLRRPVAGRRVTWSVNATNLLDNRRAAFVGTPEIGRMVMTRVQYEF